MSKERDLEIALQNEITNLLQNDKFMNQSGDFVNVNSFKHSLPNNYYGNEQEYSPYVITEVNSGTESIDSNEMQVVFTICVCDGIPQDTGDETLIRNRHCEDDLFHIKNKIVERFMKNNILNNKFICANEWQFALVDDDTSPIYYAGLSAKFSTVNIETENGYNDNLL